MKVLLQKVGLSCLIAMSIGPSAQAVSFCLPSSCNRFSERVLTVESVPNIKKINLSGRVPSSKNELYFGRTLQARKSKRSQMRSASVREQDQSVALQERARNEANAVPVPVPRPKAETVATVQIENVPVPTPRPNEERVQTSQNTAIPKPTPRPNREFKTASVDANIPVPTPRPDSGFQSAGVSDRDSSTNALCDYPQNSFKTKNCEKILSEVNQGRLPKEPVLFALQQLKQKSGLRCGGKKITNDCQVFVTDLDSRVKGYSNRSPAYFFNLCVGDKSKTGLSDVINRTYTNRGTGSSRNRYTDLPFMKTSLPGIFVANRLTGFHPYRGSRKKYMSRLGYRPRDKRCQGVGSRKNDFLRGCPVLRMSMTRLGGALTSTTKPMHTSPFKSSSGCPSINQKDNWMMRTMAAHGNSLYIAYTKSKSYKSKFAQKCQSEEQFRESESGPGVISSR